MLGGYVSILYQCCRVQPNGNAGHEGFHPAQPPQQQHQQQQTASQMPDAFDELLYTRSR